MSARNADGYEREKLRGKETIRGGKQGRPAVRLLRLRAARTGLFISRAWCQFRHDGFRGVSKEWRGELGRKQMKYVKTPTGAALLLTLSLALGAPVGATGQSSQQISSFADTRERSVAAPASTVERCSDEAAIQNQIGMVYRDFYGSYRLGPGDVIAIHVDKHPDDSLERTTVSPAGQIYY